MPKPKLTSTPAQQRKAVEAAKSRARKGTPVKPVAGGSRSVTARASRGDSGRTVASRAGTATKVRRSLRSVVEGGGPTYALKTQNGLTRYRLQEGRRSIRTRSPPGLIHMAPLPTPDHYLQELVVMTAAEAKRRWRRDIKASWGNRCAYCGSDNNLTLDHVKAKTRGGRDEARNLVPACLACNRSKGSDHWLSWWITQDSFDLGNFSRVLSHIAA